MNDSQVSDETLESWLGAAASEYEVPADAFDRVLAAAGEKGKPRQPDFSTRAWLRRQFWSSQPPAGPPSGTVPGTASVRRPPR